MICMRQKSRVQAFRWGARRSERALYNCRRDDMKALPQELPLGLPLGNGCMLAERLLPEIAYKLNAAPKYGA